MLKDPKWEETPKEPKYPLRQPWIDTMKSGEHQQISGSFGHPGRGFCAIGLAHWLIACYVQPDNPKDYYLEGPLDTDLSKFIGFRSNSGSFRHEVPGFGGSFMAANDASGCSFKQMAALAEAQPDICFLADNEKLIYNDVLDEYQVIVDDGQGPYIPQTMTYDEKCTQAAKYAAECNAQIDAIVADTVDAI
jgi:hypothetical protein